MACKHTICGICGGKKIHTKYIGVVLNDICSGKCQAAMKDDCNCKCGGKFHKGANKDLMDFLLEPGSVKAESKTKTKKSIFQPITMYDYLAEFLNGVRIKTSSFDRHSDRNYRKDNKKISLFWLSPTGKNIDTLANDFINETGFTNYDESDIINAIVNYVNDYPAGIKQYIKDVEAERIREEEFYKGDYFADLYDNKPIIFGNMKLKKGSAAAKAYMAKIRAKKGTPKKVARKENIPDRGYKKITLDILPIKHIGAAKKAVYIEFMNSSKGFKTDRKYFSSYNEALKFMNSNFEKVNPDMIKYVNATKKVGAVKKPMQTRHKDTKSHNVNIKVVSGIGSIDLNIVAKELMKLTDEINNLKTQIRATKLVRDKNELRELIKIKNSQFKSLKLYLNSIAKFR